MDVLGKGGEEGEVVLLDGDVVVVVDLVHNDDVVASAEQEAGCVRTDEARTAGEQDHLLAALGPLAHHLDGRVVHIISIITPTSRCSRAQHADDEPEAEAKQDHSNDPVLARRSQNRGSMARAVHLSD